MLYLVISVLFENIFCNRFVLSEPWVYWKNHKRSQNATQLHKRIYMYIYIFNTIITIGIKWRKK